MNKFVPNQEPPFFWMKTHQRKNMRPKARVNWELLTVTDLQGPPLERTQSDKIRDLKSLAKQYARDRGSCDDTRISYLEYVETEAEADWTLARMIAG
jgi:hypothetical protein